MKQTTDVNWESVMHPRRWTVMQELSGAPRSEVQSGQGRSSIYIVGGRRLENVAHNDAPAGKQAHAHAPQQAQVAILGIPDDKGPLRSLRHTYVVGQRGGRRSEERVVRRSGPGGTRVEQTSGPRAAGKRSQGKGIYTDHGRSQTSLSAQGYRQSIE